LKLTVPMAAVGAFLTCVTPITSQTRVNHEHRFQVMLQDGVPCAKTSGGAMYIGELFAYESVANIGVTAGDSGYEFYNPTDITLDEHGRILIIDDGNKQVAVFDSLGHFLHAFGGQGAGPGEFAQLDLAGIQGDEVMLFDAVLRRLTTFRSDGTLVGTTAFREVPLATEVRWLKPQAVLAIRPQWRVEDDKAYYWHKLTFVPTGADLVQLDGPSALTMVATDGGRTHYGRPFAAAPSLSVTPAGGILLSTGETPTLWHYDQGGELVSMMELNAPTEEISPRDKDEYVLWLRSWLPSDRLEKQLQHLPFAAAKAFWTEAYTDDRGFTWLTRVIDYRFATPPQEPRTLVVDSEGRWLGSTTVPVLISSVRGGHLMGIARNDSTGETHILVFRIHPIAPNLHY
jgi:hypothetical protein